MTSGEFLLPAESDAWLTPRWQQVSNDPVVIEAEQRLAEIRDVQRQEAVLAEELQRYFWNGRPYSRQQGGQRGEEPADWGWGPVDPSDPYKYDPADIVSDEPALDGEVRIVKGRDRLSYLINPDNVLLSAGYLWLKHRSGNDFEIPSHARGGLVHLLAADEQSVVEDKARQRSELRVQIRHTLLEERRERMRTLIPAILSRYDVDQTKLRLLHSFDNTHIEFDYIGHHVELVDYNGLQLAISSPGQAKPFEFSLQTDRLSDAIPVALAFVRQPLFGANRPLARSGALLEVSQPGLLTIKSPDHPEFVKHFALNTDEYGVEVLEEILG